MRPGLYEWAAWTWGCPQRAGQRIFASIALVSVAAQSTLQASPTSVVGWGRAPYVLTNVPPNLTDAVAVDVGAFHAVALRENGQVVTWAFRDDFAELHRAPAGLSNVVSIAAGSWHSLALKQDGSVVAWGSEEFDRLAVPSGLSNVVSIAAGGRHSLAATADGMVIVWGHGDWGATNTPAVLGDVVQVAAGDYESWALRANGTVFAWGADTPNGRVPELTNIVSVAGKGYRALALRADGSVIALEWGRPVSSPLDSETNLVAVAVGGVASYALRNDGSVASWNADPLVGDLPNVVALAGAGGDVAINHGLALIGDGRPTQVRAPARRAAGPGDSATLNAGVVAASPASYQWRLNGAELPGATNPIQNSVNLQPEHSGVYTVTVSNRLGVLTATNSFLEIRDQPPLLLTQPGSQTVYRDATVTLEVDTEGSLPMHWQWFRDGRLLANETNATLTLPKVQLDDSGEYWVTTSNPFGSVTSARALISVGLVAVIGSDEVEVPPGLTNVTAVTAAGWASLALNGDGTVRTWGYNGESQIPEPVGLNHVVAIAAAEGNGMALKDDGTVVTWGNPMPVPEGLSNVTAIAAGVALKDDGTVVALGRSHLAGEIPAGLSNVVAIANWGLALKSDGTVVDSNRIEHPLDSLSNVVAIAAGSTDGYRAALTGDGRVFLWSYLNTPREASGLTNVVAISLGDGGRYAAIRADGTLVSSFPVPNGLSNVVAVAAGRYHAVVLVGDGRPTPLGKTVTRTAFSSTSVAFHARVVGAPPLFYQWYQDGNLIPGANRSVLNLNNVGLADSGRFSVAVSNLLGAVVLTNAILEVTHSAPRITAEPVGVRSYPGAVAAFTVRTEGSPPLRYQWFFGENPIGSATNASLTLEPIGFSDAGEYHVQVANPFGTVTSQAASLSVGPLVPGGYYRNPDPHCFFFPAYVPPETDDIVAIACGHFHTVGLRRDGTVTQWGNAHWCGRTPVDVPEGLSGIVAVAAGPYHNYALKNDGTLTAWGDFGWQDQHRPPPLSNVVSVAARDLANAVLLADGRVVTWGYYSTEVPADLTNVASIAVGNRTAQALTSDGRIMAFGRGASFWRERTGDLTNVVGMAAGYSHLIALHRDGTVTVRNSGNYQYTNAPPEATNVVAVAAGIRNTLAVRQDGTLVAWGEEGPYPPPGLTHVVSLVSGDYHLMARVADEPPPPPGNQEPQLEVSSSDSGRFGVRFATLPGAVYLLESTASLSAPNWRMAKPLLLGDGSVQEMSDLTAGRHQGFYRIRRTQ